MEQSETAIMQPETTAPQPTRTLSGRWVVVGMLAFGLLLTSTLRFYWILHLKPFMPLQLALATEFENSSPRVEGGQRRMHKGTPRLLRITMRCGFDPEREDAETAATVDQMLTKIWSIAGHHLDLAEYNEIELHLYQPDPEKALRQKSFTRVLDYSAGDPPSADGP